MPREASAYACLQQQSFAAPPYKITPLRAQDILHIKDWRNAQMDILRQSVLLTDEMQAQYFQNIVVPSFASKEPAQILFSFLYHDTCIGYGGLVHIAWVSKRAEISFLVDPQRADNETLYVKDFTAFLTIIKQVAFGELHFHRLFTETFDMRPTHIATLENNGFSYEGRMKEHVYLNGKFIDSLLHGCVQDE